MLLRKHCLQLWRSFSVKKIPIKPSNPRFGSGPCAKYPTFDVTKMDLSLLGRSHRSSEAQVRIKNAVDLTRKILKIPTDYYVGFTTGSDTAAVEMTIWNLLGSKPVDIFAWEAFGLDWKNDIQKELQVNSNIYLADYGFLPRLSSFNPDHDMIFTYNGTTSGVRVPNLEWISSERNGITICDATSAAFANELNWDKLDVTTFSWQKVLGGEAGVGTIVMSPRAYQRLFNPYKRPIPKLFRFSSNFFEGGIPNTLSLYSLQDYIMALQWADSIGGLAGLISRADQNLKLLETFVASRSSYFSFLAENRSILSNTSPCLKCNFDPIPLTKFLSKNEVAYDINSYKSAPPGLRIWTGATVKHEDLDRLLQWIDYYLQHFLK